MNLFESGSDTQQTRTRGRCSEDKASVHGTPAKRNPQSVFFKQSLFKNKRIF